MSMPSISRSATSQASAGEPERGRERAGRPAGEHEAAHGDVRPRRTGSGGSSVGGRLSPVSSSVLSRESTSGQPLLIMSMTRPSGSSPSWTTVSLHRVADGLDLERHLRARLGGEPLAHLVAEPERRGQLGRERVPGVREPAVGLGLEHDLLGVGDRDAAAAPRSSCEPGFQSVSKLAFQ